MGRKHKDINERFIDNLRYQSFMLGDFKIDKLKRYLSSIEKFFNDKEEEILQKIKIWQNPENENEYYPYDFYLEDYIDFNSDFRKIKLESSFLASYSILEYHLKSMTEEYRVHFDLKITVNDLSGNNYILRSKNYLEKVIELDLSTLNEYWNEISKYQKIRNKIVHNESKIDNISSELSNEIRKMDGIELAIGGWLRLTDKVFIINFLELTEKYINKIIDLTEVKINKV